MPELTFRYIAHRYKPRGVSDQRLLLFVASATDIRSWAGVPRKAFDYQHGFQRTLSPTRVSDVAQYFSEDANNISPTSIVVGFTDAISVRSISTDADSSLETVEVIVAVPDFSAIELDELAALALVELERRIPAPVIEAINNDVELAFTEAMHLQDEDVVDLAFGIESEESVDTGTGSDPIERSYLADFYAQLLGYRRRLVEWPEERELREILYSLLKPAIIVDGQHRVFGAATADRTVQFAVCGIPDSSWAESVYQFVVINQKAKPIKPAFLSSIIATSLSTDEIEGVYDRLKTSRIDVERAETMNTINIDPRSPFRGMIDFEVKGSQGFLQFPGMARLAKDFSSVPRTHPVLLRDGAWASADGHWLEHFFGLWSGVRSYFEGADDRLWRQPSDDHPNNLLKIVTLQECQSLMLDNWADSRVFRFQSPADTANHAEAFWRDFPPTFFTDEWRQKGLQTSVGRNLLRNAITETRRNIGRRNWGHRRLGLFKDS